MPSRQPCLFDIIPQPVDRHTARALCARMCLGVCRLGCGVQLLQRAHTLTLRLCVGGRCLRGNLRAVCVGAHTVDDLGQMDAYLCAPWCETKRVGRYDPNRPHGRSDMYGHT